MRKAPGAATKRRPTLAFRPPALHGFPMTDFPTPKFIDVGGVTLAVYEAGEASSKAPPIMLVHGWPETAYSWKHQMTALADAGFHVIAPDLKGFGRSDAPKDVAQYDIHHMTDDLIHLLDAMGIDKAIFCGHDWGGVIVWPLAHMHKDRVAGVIGVCTAHYPPLAIPEIDKIRANRGDKHYIVTFNDDLSVEDVFTGQEEKFFRTMFQRAPKRAVLEQLGDRLFDIVGRIKHGPTPELGGQVMGAEDLDVYIDAYKKSGFHGGVNLYRNIDRNHATLKDVDPTVTAPALWVGAEDDIFLPVEYANRMDQWVPDLERHVVADSGHWLMWEQPDALNTRMIDWLNRRFKD